MAGSVAAVVFATEHILFAIGWNSPWASKQGHVGVEVDDISHVDIVDENLYGMDLD